MDLILGAGHPNRIQRVRDAGVQKDNRNAAGSDHDAVRLYQRGGQMLFGIAARWSGKVA